MTCSKPTRGMNQTQVHCGTLWRAPLTVCGSTEPCSNGLFAVVSSHWCCLKAHLPLGPESMCTVAMAIRQDAERGFHGGEVPRCVWSTALHLTSCMKKTERSFLVRHLYTHAKWLASTNVGSNFNTKALFKYSMHYSPDFFGSHSTFCGKYQNIFRWACHRYHMLMYMACGCAVSGVQGAWKPFTSFLLYG